MFRDVFATFGRQFPDRRIRALMIAVIALMAAVPVGELLVLQIFSTLLVDGPTELADQGGTVLGLLAIFFVGFAITRGLHHMTKFWRVQLFRRAFNAERDRTGVETIGWAWSVAFSVSSLISELVQVVALVGLLLVLDLFVGAVCAVLLAAVLIQLSILYQRQIRVQRDLMESSIKDVEAPIRARVFSAEFSAVATSIATGLALALVVWRTFTGALLLATAIVLALALRIFFSRVSGLGSPLMRFVRDSLRLERDASRLAARTAAAREIADARAHNAQDAGTTDAAGQISRAKSRVRAVLIDRVLIEGQRGESAAYHQALSRLWSEGELTTRERDAIRGAEAFLGYSTPPVLPGRNSDPVYASWWPKPMPGSFDEWLNPYILHAVSRRAVRFVSLTAAVDGPPHIVLGGSLVSHLRPNSVAVGTGISKLEARVNPDAHIVSLRGPLSSRAVRRDGGPDVDTFGDPRLLIRRVLRLSTAASNGRLAFIRNHSDAEIPFQLSPEMDEYPIGGGKPDQIVASINAMAGYDGVVTTSLGVAMICHSYGIPCAITVLEGSPRAKRIDMECRDHVLGAELEGDWRTHPTGVELDRMDWRGLLLAERVSSAKLTEIGGAIDLALHHQAELMADELERGLEDLDDEED